MYFKIMSISFLFQDSGECVNNKENLCLLVNCIYESLNIIRDSWIKLVLQNPVH